MKSTKWPIVAELERLIAASGPEGVPAGAFNAIADRLEEAVAAPDAGELAAASEQLEELTRLLVQQGSDALRDAIRGRAHPDIKAALLVGQAAFAQNFAARSFDKRADDRFAERMTDPRYEGYVRALLSGPMNGRQLEQATGETTETVSRKLAVLRGLGIVECRREGNRIINFLNPAAKAVLTSRNIAPLVSERARPIAPVVAAAIADRMKGMADHEKRTPLFGTRC